jgi:alkanesulfonate monooxygenase SsuD/methylene tetrahydromethanopterin reductase-like flavin-dependent oxidoreductase (luciferase family)
MAAGDARDAAELAAVAEESGWDGFFVWESIWGIDAWVMLGAAAMTTERIRLGTMLTPLPRRKPWDVAGQTSTVDNLSNGRVILAVGLGVSGEERFWLFEDDPGRKVRAELMDESLEMLQYLWRDEPFEYSGKHYRSKKIADLMPPAPPPPVQQPRIRTWVVGAWPRPKSSRRPERRRHSPPLGRGRRHLVDRRRLVLDGPHYSPRRGRTPPQSRPTPGPMTPYA